MAHKTKADGKAKERTPAQLAAVEKMRKANEEKRLTKLGQTSNVPRAGDHRCETIEDGQVQTGELPDEAVLAVIGAKHFGSADTGMASLPASVSGRDGKTYSASRNLDGSIKLVIEADRNLYDSKKWRLDQLAGQHRSSHMKWNAAKKLVENNPNATPDMMPKLQKLVDDERAVLDAIEAEQKACYDAVPSLRRERNEADATRLQSRSRDLRKQSAELRLKADKWRETTDFLPADAIAAGADPSDRNEIKAIECDKEADRLEKEADDKAGQAQSLLDAIAEFPLMPGQTEVTFQPGEVVGLTV